ncbi:MAG: hypothetical protein IKK59_03365 [Lachnospiraceae bacterium]|nr:hypothetical protein [Lachnospiraceae bacterium]
MNLDKIKYLIDEAVSEHEVPCSDIMIAYQGKVVYRYMNGTIGDEKEVPIKGDELYFLYSATKPITIQNLFSITSGMNYDLNSPSILAQRAKKPDSSTLEMVRAMAGEPLDNVVNDFFDGRYIVFS